MSSSSTPAVAVAATPTSKRRVHFAEDVSRLPPRTPSPTWSDASSSESSSSSASSVGPSTPPMNASPLPAPSASPSPSSDSDGKPAQIHGALAFHPTHGCQLDSFDLSLHPSRMAPPHGVDRQQWMEQLEQPATSPPMAEMLLVSANLPWHVTVRSSVAEASDRSTSSPATPNAYLSPDGMSTARPSYVTVNDVLSTLYTFLRTPLTHDEYNNLPLDHQKRVARAYARRIRRIDERKRETERAKGVKRIDMVLAEDTPFFDGLGATKRSRALWVLNLRS